MENTNLLLEAANLEMDAIMGEIASLQAAVGSNGRGAESIVANALAACQALVDAEDAEVLAVAFPVEKKWTLQKDRPEQNGIKRPSAGTVCAAVWEAVEALGVTAATSKQMRAVAAEKGWNTNNVSIEFYRCRQFHGIGRAV